MKRWFFNLVVALSLLLSISAAAAWALSYAQPPRWRLVGVAHSADLTRLESEAGTVLFTTAAHRSNAPRPGFWDAGWALSRSGRLTLLTQVIDHEGTLHRIYASPPSLIVDVPGGARPPTVVFGRMPHSGPRATWLGFALHSDAQSGDDGDGVGAPISARAWMVTLPYWFLVMLGLPMPLLRLRATSRRRHASERPARRETGAPPDDALQQ